jgi:hypothetical protein
MIDRLTLIGSSGAAAPLPGSGSGSGARALLAALARGRWSGKLS